MFESGPSAGEEEVARLLADHPLTDSLSDSARSKLAGLAELVEFRAGATVVRQGEVGDAAFLVTAGRLIATVDGAQVGVIGRGETVGEMALITGEPRSATVTARRPTRAVRIGAAQFDSLLATSPEVYRSLTTLVVGRLERTLSGRRSWTAHATVVGVAAADPELRDSMAQQLSAALGELGRPSVIVSGTTAAGGPSSFDLAAIEADHEVVIVSTTLEELVNSGHDYDRALLFARSTEPMPKVTPGSISDLVLQHPTSVTVPRGTVRWLRALEPGTHHHVRVGSERDMGRVARRLVRREHVLVLGGGGARGFAHLGVYQALTEAGVEIDAIVGVSAGAIFGSAMALDWTPEYANDQGYTMLAGLGRMVDFTIPVVALGAGRRITEALQNNLGSSVEMEDLWRPMSCLTADLTTLQPRLVQTGLLWRAVRASAAVPGIFPPVLEGDSILVDGGVIDNLPIEAARKLYPGAVLISSDVGRQHEPLPANIPGDGIVTGWQALWNRVVRRKRTLGMIHVLYRLTALGDASSAAGKGDVHIDHTIDGIGLFDFAGGRPAIASGYELTKKVLNESPILDLP